VTYREQSQQSKQHTRGSVHITAQRMKCRRK